MARTTKYNQGIQAAICDALRAGNTRRCACALVKIDSATFYIWLKDKPAFFSAVEEAEAEAEQRFVGCVKDAGITSWQAAAWWLERRHHLDWRKRESHDVDLTTRSDDELAAIIAAALGKPDSNPEASGS
ncbi:MAG TPA: hypothetical protein VGM51_09620 [Armatimonadota bacterium]|jgi:hypothetical protein